MAETELDSGAAALQPDVTAWGEQARHDIQSVLPARAEDLARLLVLANAGLPVITVIGKYNHGKSRLLNELLGRDVFAVADRRETVVLSRCEHDGVAWLDAPGIDADVGYDDDRQALQAAWRESDIRLFVHSAKEGELDARELALLGALRADSERTARPLVFVLSQVDQLAGSDELDEVMATILRQLPDVRLHPVSSSRHRLGVEGGKLRMLESSGIPSLRIALAQVCANVPGARQDERAMLVREVRDELLALQARHAAEQASLQDTQRQQELQFVRGLEAVFAKVGMALQVVIDAPVEDVAQHVDSAADHFRQTAAKLERARIQVAYSRACVEIDSYLIGQGVTSLPEAQQTGIRAMDSVMVAIMGVSVKWRADLRRMFCEAAGIQRLQQECLRYFEWSKDRRALAAAIAEHQAACAAVAKALSTLGRLA